MENNTAITIVILAILLMMSAYFSATETAFSSLNKIRIKNMASDGNKRAQLVLRMSDNYDRILSTILIGNNIVNIVSASLATVLFVEHYGDAGVAMSTIVMTVLVLIFGEISPKSLAKENPENFAMFSAPILQAFCVILYPVNIIFMQWKKLLTKMFHISRDTGMTEEELITIVEEATQDGGLNEQEGELIRSAIEFNDLDVTDILTPRIDVVGISVQDTKKQVYESFRESGYSRLPVYEETVDHIVGVINLKDFYNSEDKPIQEILKPVFITPAAVKISKLLKSLQSSKTHFAVVIDEYGGTLGIVTMEDIIEELVGEIWDEHDEVINEIEKISENEYLINCGANLDKMFRVFDMDEDFDATTVSGWVVEELGEIPKVGDSFTYENLHITVTKTEFRRVQEIRVQIQSSGSSEDDD